MGGSGRTDPDEVGLVEGDGVAAPDVLWVELGDVDVLDDDVLCSVGDAETFATDDTLVANTDEGLVGTHVDGSHTSIVVLDLDRRGACSSVSVITPVGRVDGVLTSVARAFVGCGTAAGGCCGSLSTLEVELSVEHDTACCAVAEPGLQLGYRRGYNTGCIATSRSTSSEAFRCAFDSV